MKNIHERAAITKNTIDCKVLCEIKQVKEDNERLINELIELRI
jgi:hypothetical protein